MLQVIGQSGVVQALMGSLPYMSDEDVASPLTFISALIVSPSAKQFAIQFVEAGGASAAAVARCDFLNGKVPLLREQNHQ